MVGRAVAKEAKSAMGHNVVLIGGLWLVATVAVWLVCRWRGYAVAA